MFSCIFLYVLATLPDFGIPGYSCDANVMKKSKKVPTNVNSVRPADIKLIMALGDSLTVGGLFSSQVKNFKLG